MTLLSSVATMFRRIQHYLFDPGGDDASSLSSPRRRCAVILTPEQRLKRKKLRDLFLRRQLWIIPDAKPPKKKKLKKRRRRKARGRQNKNSPRLRKVDPNRVLKRQYKPLETPLYNLPAGLVDKLEQGRLNLRKPRHRQHAHKIVDAVARIYIDRECMDPDEVKAMHDAIDKLADNPLPIADQLADIRKAFEQHAEEVQNGWSQHHRDKVNNYYLPPMEVERVRYDGGEGGGRELSE